MFVDACAIVALIAGEPTAADHAAALEQSKSPWTSALAAWEAIIVLARPDQLNCGFRDAEDFVVEWLEARDIALREPPSPREVLAHAVAVAEKHGVGKRALSNLDCFHYAYAKTTNEPLLTLDAPLRATDVATRP
jgi:ribonuclease VapC